MHIGKQLNVIIKTPQTKRFSENAVFSPIHIKKLLLQILIYLNVCERVQKLRND